MHINGNVPFVGTLHWSFVCTLNLLEVLVKLMLLRKQTNEHECPDLKEAKIPLQIYIL